MPSLCSPQQRPLSPIPPDHILVEAEVQIVQIVEEATLEGAVAGAEDKAGPCRMPLILPTLKNVKLP